MIISPIIYENNNSIIGHMLCNKTLTIYFDNNFGSSIVKYNEHELIQDVENFCLKIFNRTYVPKTFQKNQCSINISIVNINVYNQIYKNHLIEYIGSTCNKRLHHLKYFKGKLAPHYKNHIEALYNDQYRSVYLDRALMYCNLKFNIFLKTSISYNEYIENLNIKGEFK